MEPPIRHRLLATLAAGALIAAACGNDDGTASAAMRHAEW